ncbi:Lrp/AsnC family transcriptional regulator [Candidatus Bathyarchaeota archaeon]|nr:Lrp/AsnC family transcriptional regulator [Candidatus Bathyarchaeota archaeon]
MTVSVYVLIQTRIGEAWNVARKIAEMKGVKMAHAVTGIYDVIAYAELDDLEEIKNLITEVHTLEGVEKTHTAVSF